MGTMLVLKSRRAMLDTLLKHLNMLRISAATIVLTALVGCTGLIDSGNGNLTPEQRLAQEKWEDKALPVFKAACTSCHAGSTQNVGFLVGATDMAVHDTLMGFDPQVVNTDAPESSRVLTKGPHSGPALEAQQASDILEWIQAEHDAAAHSGSGTTIIQTAQFQPQLCTGGSPDNAQGTCPTNHVSLAALGLPGAEIDFVAQPLSQDTYVTDLRVIAAADGAYLEHPLFVSVPPMGDVIPDSLDRFFNIKVDLMAAGQGPIGGGTAAFVGFAPSNQMYITFKTVSKYVDMSGGGTGGTTGDTGCKVLASFKTNAQPQLQTNCASCHANAGNAAAVSAMDITNINAPDDATLQLACNQVRSRINFQTIDQSGFFIAPDPNSGTNHPFKFPAGQFQPFHDAVVIWANAEKTAQ